jgi:hypothetical protein
MSKLKVKAEIPDNYKELKAGDIIYEDDLAFNEYSHIGWIKEIDLGANADVGATYKPGAHFLTIREIGKERTKSENLWSFYRLNGNPPLLVSSPKGGFIFCKNGSVYSGPKINTAYTADYCKKSGLKPVANIKEALKLINPDAKNKIYEILNIEREKIEVSDKDINNLVNFLKEKRAFNGDSALKMEEKKIDICYELTERGIIKSIGERFYID